MNIIGLQRTVNDLGRAVDFYCGALGFTRDDGMPGVDPGPRPTGTFGVPVRCARLRLGDAILELVAPVGFERRQGTEEPRVAVSNAAFQALAIVTPDIDAALTRLHRYSPWTITNDAAAVRLPPESGGAMTTLFRDLDGHPVALIQPAPGAPRPSGASSAASAAPDSAARPGARIDHIALSVADADRSIAFYAEHLGTGVALRRWQRGPEQARLDGVVESVVERVLLEPTGQTEPTGPAVPHIELLAYQVPAPEPATEAGPIDRDHADRLLVDIERPFAVGEERLLRDPDGHLLLLREQAPAPPTTSD